MKHSGVTEEITMFLTTSYGYENIMRNELHFYNQYRFMLGFDLLNPKLSFQNRGLIT